MKFRATFLSISAMLLFSSCTHQKVSVRRVDDAEMSCSEIRNEIKQTEKIRADIDSKTGISGRNVGMALLFWPGIIVNQVNASDADKLANERMSILVALYEKKKCSLSGTTKVSLQKSE